MIFKYICNDCPRECNALRTINEGNGYCRCGTAPQIAKVMKHLWEEPCISGTKGAGNIFFAGCNLKCCYCQNKKITTEFDYNNSDYSKYSSTELSKLLYNFSQEDVNNINLVTADCYLRTISKAITPSLKESIDKPIILNCSGYNKPEMLEALRGKIDIFLPDLKYLRNDIAEKYSNAPDYPEVAKKAILKMFEITGPCVMDESGLLKKGVVIRHLILPGNLYNTFDVIDWVNETFAPGEIIFSLMSQYTPCNSSCESIFPELARKLTPYEKKKAEAYLLNTDITSAYIQDAESADTAFIPEF